MKKILILILLLFLIAGCTKVAISSNTETIQADHNKVDVISNTIDKITNINQTEVEVKSFGDVV